MAHSPMEKQNGTADPLTGARSEARLQDDKLAESLSALVDGEVSEMELHRLLRAGEDNDQLRQTWGRYQLISSAMRRELPVSPQVDLSAAISGLLDEEAAHQPSRRRTWLPHFGKFAVAASAAAVMVLTTQLVDVGGLTAGGAGAPVAATAPATERLSTTDELLRSAPVAPLPSGFQSPALNARTVSSQPGMPVSETQPQYYPALRQAPSAGSAHPSPEVQAYLQQVMEAHAGHSAINSGRGMMPYARLPVEAD